MIPPIESDVQYRDFLREAQIMRQLEHENIVKIYEFREDTPMLIIMEYVSQGSLQTYVSSNRPNLRVEDLLHFASNIANVSYSRCLVVISLQYLFILGYALPGAKQNRSQRLGGS
jgi:serine/threonine protein kinase